MSDLERLYPMVRILLTLVVMKLCQDKESCKVAATLKTFGDDPCPGTSKYLEVAYKCRPNEFRHRVECEGETLHISCKRSLKIAVYSAVYGRERWGVQECPADTQLSPQTECLSECATKTVMDRCQGRRRCRIEASDDNFRNNCLDNVSKYLDVIFTCVPRRILKEIHSYVGEPPQNIDCSQEDGIPTLPTAMPTRKPRPTLPTAFVLPSTSTSTTTTTTPAATTAAQQITSSQQSTTTPSITTTITTTNKPTTTTTRKPAPNTVTSTTTTTSSTNKPPLITHLISKPPRTDVNDVSSFHDDVTVTMNTTFSIPVIKSSYGHVYLGVINDWIRTYNYIRENLERCILYMAVSVCIGIICVLILVAIRLNMVGNKYKRHAKLDNGDVLVDNSRGILGSTVVQQASPDEDLTSLGSSSNNDLDSVDMYGMSHNSRRPPPFPTNDSLNRTLNHYYG